MTDESVFEVSQHVWLTLGTGRRRSRIWECIPPRGPIKMWTYEVEGPDHALMRVSARRLSPVSAVERLAELVS